MSEFTKNGDMLIFPDGLGLTVTPFDGSADPRVVGRALDGHVLIMEDGNPPKPVDVAEFYRQKMAIAKEVS